MKIRTICVSNCPFYIGWISKIREKLKIMRKFESFMRKLLSYVVHHRLSEKIPILSGGLAICESDLAI